MANKSQNSSIRTLLVVAAFAALPVLAGCSGGGGGGDTSTPPTVQLAQQKFGLGFATAFAATPNSDPREPSLNDIIALSLTTDPFEVP